MAAGELMRGLGLDPARRAVILHADDVGMCHGANTAFVELSRSGALTCGSVMVPCPWFPEIARIAAASRPRPRRPPDADQRMALLPLGPADPSRRGFRTGRRRRLFPAARSPRSRRPSSPTRPRPRCGHRSTARSAFGIDVTHIDTHMGAALSPPLLDIYCRLGRDYRLPVLLPRDSRHYAEILKLDMPGPREIFDAAVARLDAGHVPLVDDFRMTPGVPHAESDAAYRSLVTGLPAGLTFLALHPNAPGDIETIVPPRAHFRTDEYRLLASGAIAETLAAEGIQTIGMRALRDLYRRQPQPAVP